MPLLGLSRSWVVVVCVTLLGTVWSHDPLQISALKNEIASLKSNSSQTSEALAGQDQKDIVRKCCSSHTITLTLTLSLSPSHYQPYSHYQRHPHTNPSPSHYQPYSHYQRHPHTNPSPSHYLLTLTLTLTLSPSPSHYHLVLRREY